MNIVEIAKVIPAGKKVAIMVNTTSNIWPVEEVIEYYKNRGITPPEVVKLDTEYCPEFGDTEPMIQIYTK